MNGFGREEGQSCAATVPVLLMVAKVCVASYNLLMQDKELECVHGTYSDRQERFAAVRCGVGLILSRMSEVQDVVQGPLWGSST